MSLTDLDLGCAALPQEEAARDKDREEEEEEDDEDTISSSQIEPKNAAAKDLVSPYFQSKRKTQPIPFYDLSETCKVRMNNR